ncbi:MAG: hypothetical protein IJ465_00855 [Clostridia bacterium]|nr:hypothetical protein [Clostridia bacterium]
MKNARRIIGFLLTLAMVTACLTGCINTGGSKQITYSEYTIAGIVYELPSHWTVTQETDSVVTVGRFTAMLNETVSTSGFDSFCKGALLSMLLRSHESMELLGKVNYGGYELYEYAGTVAIAGDSIPVKAVCVLTSEGAVLFNYVCDNAEEDHDAIYSHFLNSLK